MTRRALACAFAVALLLPPAARGQSLEECLALARRNAPTLQASEAAVTRAEHAIREARAALAPTMRLDASFLQYSEAPKMVIPIAIPGSPGPQLIDLGKSQALDVRAEARLPVYSGGRDQALVRAAEAARGAQQHGREQAEADLVLRVSSAFYRAIAAERLALAAHATVDSARAHLAVTVARVRAGVAPRVDSLRARVDLMQRLTGRLRADQAVRLTRIDLENAIGAPLDTTRTLVPPGDPDARVPEPDEALARAVRSRPELAAYDESLREAAERARAARAGRRPEVSLQGTAEYTAPNREGDYLDVSDPGLRTYRLFAGVAVSMPVFDGGLAAARAGQREADRAALGARRRETELALRREVERAIADLQIALAVWQTDSDRVHAAEEALRLAEAGYRGGTATAADVRDAEAALADARAGEAQSLMDYWIARASLDHATGGR